MTQTFQSASRAAATSSPAAWTSSRRSSNNPTSDAATLGVRALPAARAARRPLDRGVGPAGHPGVGAGVLRPGQVERAAEPHGQRRPALGRPQGAADADAAVARRRSRSTSAIRASRPTPARSRATTRAGSRASASRGIRAATARRWCAARPASSRRARPAWSGPTRARPTASSSRNYTGVIVGPGLNFGVPTFPNLVDTSDFVQHQPGHRGRRQGLPQPAQLALEPRRRARADRPTSRPARRSTTPTPST